MAGRGLSVFAVGAFALAVGHLAWHAWVGPPLTPNYFVGADGAALCAPGSGARQLYLRRLLYLSRRPRHAWLEVVTRDRVRVYANGWSVGDQTQDGFAVAVVADLTPYLQEGRNVLAVVAGQASAGPPPAVHVRGGYSLDDGAHPIGPDPLWRCNTVFDRKASWWFATDFDDAHWPAAGVVDRTARAKLVFPPGAATAPDVGRWITPAAVSADSAVVRRSFSVAARPRQAWLRVTTTSAYRVAVNGLPVDQQEDQLGTPLVVPAARRSYDLTAFVRRGRNTIRFVLTRPGAPPHLLADLEVEDQSGRRYRLGTDGEWLSSPGLPPDWLADAPAEDGGGTPCLVESGDVGVPPWEARRESLKTSLPTRTQALLAAQEAAFILGVALLTYLVCRAAARALAAVWGGTDRAPPARAVSLTLLPAALVIGAGVLATYDPRVGRQDVYRGSWVVLAVLSVLGQWALLALLAHRRAGKDDRPSPPGIRPRSSVLVAAVVAALFGVGLWLRVRDVAAEPLHHDEGMHYRMVQGLLKRGFPSFEVHPDLPVHHVSTSELVFYSMALATPFFDDPRYVVRSQAVVWGALTILLVYGVGRRLFGRAVGLTAAALYAFAANCIQMADFGRYLSQVQFFTLLTVYFFWRTVHGAGRVDRRALAYTAASFVAMYLSWEGSALIVPGMVLAALLERRGRLGTLLGDRAVWAAALAVLAAALAQYAHREFYLAQLLRHGTGASDAALMPMWRFPGFDPWFFVRASGWSRDTLLPMLGLAGAGALAVRHGFRRPCRFLGLIFLTTGLLMALLLSVRAWRYSYFLPPLLVLLSAAALVGGVRALAGRAWAAGPAGWRAHARWVGLLAVAGTVALGCGMTVQMTGLVAWRLSDLEALGLDLFKFPDHTAAARYLREHMREGDVLMSNRPFLVDILTDHPTDYWPESRLYIQAVLDDRRSLPRHYYGGTPMVADRRALEEVFARHRRVWYLTVPLSHSLTNDAEVTAFVRQHMDVVYEDFSVVVLFRGRDHRPAALRRENEEQLRKAQADPLR